ncbi:zinc metalloproteinase nas-13-like [Sitodiplosis mosellana]|uniref:zinc metalloproteinase nas-13-like n=1 Tax=Sitodiplosis mosellana TaxID=263140 RepID=UPI002444CD4A|nr:zinc metalloproteinase nas-13-like [Sitodiplosis mosellana]
MDLTIEQARALDTSSRNGLIESSKRWPNNRVFYEINDEHTMEELVEIERAMQVIESVSCVQFKERTHEHGYIVFGASGSGCSSKVGYHGNAQTINLAPKCFQRFGTIIHELLHALGFYHMQSTHDRDDYIKINYENIRTGMERNFNKYDLQRVTNFGQKYDYESVMHYSGYGFSKNGQPTIEPYNKSYTNVIGQRIGMSSTDILKLNIMYNCNSLDETYESGPFCTRNLNLPMCLLKPST